MNKHFISTLFFLIASSFIFSSCDSEYVALPNVTGKAGEVVLVISKNDFKQDIGQAFKDVLCESYPGLPQDEPYFDLVNIPESAFSSIFKTHRNLIFTNYGKQFKEAGLKVEKDKYSKPQTILNFYAPNKEKLAKYLRDNKIKIQDILVETERQRIINNYKNYEKVSIRRQLEQKHGISLYVPRGYSLDLDTNNFVWISYETPYTSQGLFIYDYPYTDTTMLTKEALISTRDSLLKAFVPGPMEGSYMSTEKENFVILFDEFMLNKKYFAELRGLWRVEGDFMGGPFISLSTVDEERNRIVTVEGYVFAPKFDKRNYLRQVEAILHTLSFTDTKD
ncbi:MAG: hypothetical protein C0594_03260 [Marinilabiliales bacterium]|nr:MAG: hypothetical protein C0594_03260 [Marinilabiliales bacterium]